MTELPTTVLGRTGLVVTKLGYGAMELLGPRARELSTAPVDADQILNAVLDAGINFIDTSPDYGDSEELIGAAIANRRDEFVLTSKCGCPVNQPPPTSGYRPEHVFTPENIRAGVEQSLRRMRTDHLDVVQIHMSPSRDELEQNGAVDALTQLRSEGKVRFIGMSGTLPNITDHIAMDVFDVFQIPYSALEREHEEVITQAADAGAGTIIRGGVARGAPDKPPPPLTEAAEQWRQMRNEAARQRRDAGIAPASTTSSMAPRAPTSCCGSRLVTRICTPPSSAPRSPNISPPTSRRRPGEPCRPMSTKRRRRD